MQGPGTRPGKSGLQEIQNPRRSPVGLGRRGTPSRKQRQKQHKDPESKNSLSQGGRPHRRQSRSRCSLQRQSRRNGIPRGAHRHRRAMVSSGLSAGDQQHWRISGYSARLGRTATPQEQAAPVHRLQNSTQLDQKEKMRQQTTPLRADRNPVRPRRARRKMVAKQQLLHPFAQVGYRKLGRNPRRFWKKIKRNEFIINGRLKRIRFPTSACESKVSDCSPPHSSG